MKPIVFFLSIFILLAAHPAPAHHMAVDIVDEEIYEMIDDLVSDTPHATLDFTDMGTGMSVDWADIEPGTDLEINITMRITDFLEMMLGSEILSNLYFLDGDVSITIEFDNSTTATMIITQTSQGGGNGGN